MDIQVGYDLNIWNTKNLIKCDRNWIEINSRLDQNQLKISYQLKFYYYKRNYVTKILNIYTKITLQFQPIEWIIWKLQSCIQSHKL